jgi:hypothetical protein
LGDFPISRIVELMPAAWANRNRQPTLSAV